MQSHQQSVSDRVLIKQDHINGQVKLNMSITFGSVLMLCSKTGQILYTPLKDSLSQLAHFRHSVDVEKECCCFFC